MHACNLSGGKQNLEDSLGSLGNQSSYLIKFQVQWDTLFQ